MRPRFLILLCVPLCLASHVKAQNTLRPKWVGNVPASNNPSFYFVEVHSDASLSLDSARTSVKKEIASNVERTDKVSVNEIFEDKSTQKYDGNKVSGQAYDSYQLRLQVQGTARPITSRRIDEYWKTVQRGNIKVLDYHALYAIERNNHIADFSNISTISSYGAAGLWRSAIMPGWGQMYKGSYIKGGLVMGGFVAGIAGIVFTETRRQAYISKTGKYQGIDAKRFYIDKAKNMETGRNICIGAAAAIYVYSLIDAIVAPGARRIIVTPAVNGDNYGVSANIQF